MYDVMITDLVDYVISAVSWLYSTISPYISVWMCVVVCGAALIGSVLVDHWQIIVSITFIILIALLLISVIDMCDLTHIIDRSEDVGIAKRLPDIQEVLICCIVYAIFANPFAIFEVANFILFYA